MRRRHFFLHDIPVLDEDSVINVEDIRRNPVRRSAFASLMAFSATVTVSSE
jgi:hypothetical protein